jgi:AcrR family transcriptional regulator
MIRTKENWIQTGIEILAEHGVDSVRIEAIARKLEVSKGGFYGYFLNRDAFLQAMLDYWAEIFTNQIIEAVGSLEGNLEEKLKKLVNLVDDKKYDGLEISMFAWANKDPKAEKVVMRVVKERLNFLTGLFRMEGFSKKEAEKRGSIFHHYIAGCRCFRPLLPKYNSPKRQAQLDHFIRLVTAPETQD